MSKTLWRTISKKYQEQYQEQLEILQQEYQQKLKMLKQQLMQPAQANILYYQGHYKLCKHISIFTKTSDNANFPCL